MRIYAKSLGTRLQGTIKFVEFARRTKDPKVMIFGISIKLSFLHCKYSCLLISAVNKNPFKDFKQGFCLLARLPCISNIREQN